MYQENGDPPCHRPACIFQLWRNDETTKILINFCSEEAMRLTIVLSSFLYTLLTALIEFIKSFIWLMKAYDPSLSK